MTGACTLCGSTQVVLFHSFKDFCLWRCGSCGLVFQCLGDGKNNLDLITETYDDHWVTMRDQNTSSTFIEHAWFSLLLLNIFLPKRGRLLEVGSGTGEFLFLARASGWEVEGFEPSGPACSYAREKYGLDLINSLWSLEK